MIENIDLYHVRAQTFILQNSLICQVIDFDARFSGTDLVYRNIWITTTTPYLYKYNNYYELTLPLIGTCLRTKRTDRTLELFIINFLFFGC